MREISSPLLGISSPFGARRNPLASYAAAGFVPKLVAAFADEFYAKEGRKSTFGGVLEHTATTNGTMIDSDGLLKWRPHNEATNPTAPATQTIIVVSGADYTVECTGVSIALSGAGTGTVTEGNPVEITAGSTSLTLTVTGSTGTLWAYRSDLGGMVNNPDTGTSYVPETGYLPRRNHHIYNGSAWVNEGVLIESESRTNLDDDSLNFTAWGRVGTTTNADAGVGPDNTLSASSLYSTSANSEHYTQQTESSLTGTCTFSVYVKALGTQRYIILGERSTTGAQVSFDLLSGTVVSEGLGKGHIELIGNGWFRCGLTPNSALSSQNFGKRVQLDNNGSLDGNSYAGNTSDGLLIFGSQVEVGSTPSSYIPTNGSQVARAGDQLVLPHENISWPEPVVIGDELVANGAFDTDSDWTKGTGWTISGGTATHSGSGGDIYQSVTCVVGQSYVCKATVDATGDPSITNTAVQIRNSSNTSSIAQVLSSGITPNGVTQVQLTFVATETTHLVRVYSEDEITLDNISLKEIEPLALSIHMQGLMTYADGGNFREVSFYKWTETSTNEIETRISTAGGFEGLVQFVQDAGSEIALSSGSDSYSPDINVPFNIASRHGSTFVNGAVDGTALTENTTPVALPDLETTDLQLAYDFMGAIKQFDMWDENITDTGLEDATDD
jgi:hypothetical protein